MRFAWSTAVKDWRRRLRDPLALLVWIGIPLLVGGLMTMVSGGKSGPSPRAHVLVVDQDSSFVSNLLIGALSQDAAGGVITAERVEREKGMARMDKGNATALLIIPAGFSDAVLLERPMALELLTNPSQRILPGIVEEMFNILVDGTFYLHRLIGEDLRAFAANPPEGDTVTSNERIAAFSVKLNELSARIREDLFPPVVDLQVGSDEDEVADDDVSLGLLFLPGILFMALLFIAQGITMDFWEERRQMTLRRVAVTPQNILWFSLGKIIAGAGVVFIVAAISLCVAYAYFGLDMASLPLALVWTVLSGILLLTVMMTLNVHAWSERGAGVLSMAVVFPLMMVGGSFFPFEAMPAWMVSVATFTPNGWALKELKAIMQGPIDAATLLRSFAGIVVVSFALFLIATRRLRAAFTRG